MRDIRLLLYFLRKLPSALFQALVVYLPGEAGILLRRWYYEPRLAQCGIDLTVFPGVHFRGLRQIAIGDDVMIRENAIIHAGFPNPHDKRDVVQIGPKHDSSKPTVTIGDHSRVAFGAVILGYGGVVLGEKCGIGPGAVVLSETYHYQGRDKSRVYKYSQGAAPGEQLVLRGAVKFLDGAGIASSVIVLPGSTIGRDAWVGPSSVVRVGGNIKDNVVAKGNPAKTVFKRSYADARSSGETS